MPEEAFELLVERSQHENRKLRLVADDVVREVGHDLEGDLRPCRERAEPEMLYPLGATRRWALSIHAG